MLHYREKIYKYYSSISGSELAPVDKDGLNVRAPFFNMLIQKHFPVIKNISILELGCGHGAFLHFIKGAGYINYKGIDGSEEQVNEAKRLGIENVILGDLVDHLKHTESNSIDLLLAIDVIEHFTKNELSDLVDEFYRVLKKNGKVITHQPNCEGPFGNVIRYSDYTHEQAFARTSISQIFLASGFSSIDSFEDAPIAHGLKSYIRSFLWSKLLKNIYKILIVIERGGVAKDIILTHNFYSVIIK